MTTATAFATIEDGLVAITAALVLNTRNDGSSYRSVSDKHPYSEDIRETVRELHDGELPNDWRYDMVYFIAQGMLEYSECTEKSWTIDQYEETISEISYGLSDDFNGDLLEWAQIGSRLEFQDPEIVAPTTNICDLLKARQREEIETMAYTLLYRLAGL